VKATLTLAPLAVLGFAAVSCGSAKNIAPTNAVTGTTTITADSAAKTLREAGFSIPYIARIPAGDVRRGQLGIVSVSHPHAPPRWPLARVIVYKSSQAAEKFFRTGCWTAAQLLKHRPGRNAGARPPCPRRPWKFSADRLLAYRICNVIFTSYNQNNPSGTALERVWARRVTTHARHAVTSLRGMC
jgi:hypothetical protein